MESQISKMFTNGKRRTAHNSSKANPTSDEKGREGRDSENQIDVTRYKPIRSPNSKSQAATIPSPIYTKQRVGWWGQKCPTLFFRFRTNIQAGF